MATVTDAPVRFDEVRTMTEELPQMLRSDARHNRDRVVRAARSLFAEHGIDFTMREIARRAGVGPATLYRRFPTKQALIDAAFAEELRACRGIVEEGCADQDAWRGFRTVIEQITVLNTRNLGFVDAFLTTNPDADSFVAHRSSLVRKLAELSVRAQRAGGLRRDFVIDDLMVVLHAGRGLASIQASEREAAAQRFAALSIAAFRASDENTRLPRPPRLAPRRAASRSTTAV